MTRRNPGRTTAIALSIMTHVVIFALIANTLPSRDVRTLPVAATTLWLVPHLTLKADTVRPHQAAKADTAAMTTVSRPMPQQKTTTRPAGLQTTKVPSASQAESPSGAASPSTTAGAGEGIQGALRTGFGCDLGHLAHLTLDERDRCNQRMGEDARKGPSFIDSIPPEKRAYYDAVQGFAQASRHPDAPLYKDANGNIRRWGGPPAPGCTFRPHFRPGASLSDKIKATGMIGVPIGPLSCGVQLPQGVMTPEIGIPTP